MRIVIVVLMLSLAGCVALAPLFGSSSIGGSAGGGGEGKSYTLEIITAVTNIAWALLTIWREKQKRDVLRTLGAYSNGGAKKTGDQLAVSGISRRKATRILKKAKGMV